MTHARPITIISPHLDDAVLSCGEHILKWQKEGREVRVITVFTKFQTSVLSTDSQDYLRKSGFTDLNKFERARLKEDQVAMKLLGLKQNQVSYLGFVDGGFRTTRNQVIYQNHRQLFAGKVLDSQTFKLQVKKKLLPLLKKDQVVVLPLGIGGHADHVLLQQFTGELRESFRVMHYFDFPYALQLKNWSLANFFKLIFKRASITWTSKQKLKVLRSYSSQIKLLFTKETRYPEILLKKNELALKTSLKLKQSVLNFQVGSFSSVTSSLLKEFKTKSLIVLPCTLYDLAQVWYKSEFRKLYRYVDVCTTDGMPLVYWFRAQTQNSVERVYGPDLMKEILSSSAQTQRHFFVCPSLQTKRSLMKYLHTLAPSLKVAGAVVAGNMSKEKEELRIYKEIKRTKPQFVWIGVGSPTQVKLAVNWRKKIKFQVSFLCVGAAFDFLAGVKPSAPNWMKKSSLEWLYRLIHEPQRLGDRYLRTVPSFLLAVSWSSFRKKLKFFERP